MIPKNRISNYMDDNMKPDISNANKLLHEFAGAIIPPEPPPKQLPSFNKSKVNADIYYHGYDDGYQDACIAEEFYLKDKLVCQCTYTIIGLLSGIAIGISIGVWI